MKTLTIVALGAATFAATLAAPGARAEERIRFYNDTSATISQLQFAPAGTSRFGANQCDNDRDGTVSPGERLRITNTPPGRYDVRLVDTKGRTCLVRGVDVGAEKSFSIGEDQLKGCSR